MMKRLLKPRVVVVGAGGVGGYFGGRMAQAGHCDLQFLVRGATLAALREKGLRVDSINGDFRLESSAFGATDNSASIKPPVDLVVVTVKGEESFKAVLPSLRSLISDQTIVIPLQNGVEAPYLLMDAFGKDKVLGGYCKISSRIVSPGYIKHEAADPVIGIGEILPERIKQSSERVKWIAELFEKSGIKMEVPEDVRIGMWQKLMLITSISGVGAITRAPLAVNMSIPETREMLRAALYEVVTVAQGQGVGLQEKDAEQVYQFLKNVASKSPNTSTSLQRDIINGIPSELQWQSGAVVKKGKEVGVPTPVHSFILAALLPQEKKARKEIEYNLVTSNL